MTERNDQKVTTGFSISGGVAGLITKSDEYDSTLQFRLEGDLHQKSIQVEFLKNVGVKVYESGIYPGFKEESEYTRALKWIWADKPDGWFNYKDQMIARLICSEEEYTDAFNRLGSQPDIGQFAHSKPWDYTEKPGGWIKGVYIEDIGKGKVVLETLNGQVVCQKFLLRQTLPIGPEEHELYKTVRKRLNPESE